MTALLLRRLRKENDELRAEIKVGREILAATNRYMTAQVALIQLLIDDGRAQPTLLGSANALICYLDELGKLSARHGAEINALRSGTPHAV